jgi:signal transduction histidine kinase
MHELTQSGLNAISLRLDADIAIESDENVWISTINGHERFKMTETQHTVIDEAQYLFSEVSIDLPSNKPEEIFNVIALKPTEGLMDRTKSLISRLFILSFVAIMLTAFAIYILVRSKLRDPLENLMDGVKKMQEGRADVQVDIHVKNELATLGRSFNEMAKDVQQKSKELQLANDTLEGKVKKRTQDLQSAQKKLILSEKMASLGQLVAGVAHEINTPLGNCVTALSFNADTLEELKRKYADQKLTATDFRQFLSSSSESMQLMEKNLMRAAELMRTFKNVAVSQSVEEVSSFRLKQHIEEVLLTLNPQMRHSKIDVSIDVDEGIEVKSFAGAYYQLMSNLILNSVRHAFPDKKGHISIKIEKQAEALYFSYSDDGAGMDPQTLNKIFDPFFTTKRGAGGTGLGMYMIYNIVTQLLGGSIKASSVQGKGTQFEILLPLELPQKNAGAEHYSI